jgi:hypothetical protein
MKQDLIEWLEKDPTRIAKLKPVMLAVREAKGDIEKIVAVLRDVEPQTNALLHVAVTLANAGQQVDRIPRKKRTN